MWSPRLGLAALLGAVWSQLVTAGTTDARDESFVATPEAKGLNSSSKLYDYIVVGSGYGGIITADRLSQSGKNVLLIERGLPAYGENGGTYQPDWAEGTNYTTFDIPGVFESIFTDPNYFWWCLDYSGLFGCVVGGGAAVNAGLYWYPATSDFSVAQGWPLSWVDHQQYTDRMRARLPSTIATSADGELYLEQTATVTAQLLDSVGYTNITLNDHPDQKEHVYGYSAFSWFDGKRGGPPVTYLRTAKARPNFELLINTNVTNVIREGGKITGVRAASGVTYSVKPQGGRVVLSAGPFGTAKILFQSGVGPTDQIQRVQNSTVQGPLLPPSDEWINLPVGYNISESPGVTLVFSHPTVDAYNWANTSSNPRPADAAQYLQDRSGPLAMSSPRLNFWRSYMGTDGVKRYVQGSVRPGAGSVSTSAPYNASTIFSVSVYLTQGLTSRGRLGLTNNLGIRATITPYFTDPVDKAVLVQALQDVVDAAKNVTGLTLLTPDPTTTSVQQYIDAATPSSLLSNHWVGSTVLGTNASVAVVDENLKVFGTDNLFIVDSGIIPSLPIGNPHGVIMSAAEQGVARILALP